MRRLLYFLPLIVGSHGIANLMAPYSLESTSVLPAGVRNPRILNFTTTVSEQFDSAGDTIPVGHALNQRVTWQDVVNAQDDPIQKNLVNSFLTNAGLSAEGSPGNTSGIVKSNANVRVPVLGIGVTEKLTLAVAVPIVSLDVKVDTGFVRSEDGQRFISAICQSSPAKCNEAADKLNNAVQRKLSKLGYQPLESHSVSGIGDIQLISKYRWINEASQGFASKFSVTFPTGTDPNPDKLIDLTTGDNRFKLSKYFIYHRQLLSNVRAMGFAGYTALLAHNIEKRLPAGSGDSLSPDKEELNNKLAHQANLGAQLAYNISSAGLTVSADYQYQKRTNTRYEGSDSSPAVQQRYRWLEELEPGQSLHTMTASLEFSTVDWYRSNSFAIPLEARVSYSKPVAGTNAPSNDLLSGELVLYF